MLADTCSLDAAVSSLTAEMLDMEATI